ncbi:hypothetical protein [Cytobacillus gottheilii]|uniref:hypothetical protein n=1 Tax=Cytobacillus gottheilii TaxID=859144 RepID=UPI0009BBA30A|nr:hypothetical protein [Cytobacillus gottheilii]
MKLKFKIFLTTVAILFLFCLNVYSYYEDAKRTDMKISTSSGGLFYFKATLGAAKNVDGQFVGKELSNIEETVNGKKVNQTFAFDLGKLARPALVSVVLLSGDLTYEYTDILQIKNKSTEELNVSLEMADLSLPNSVNSMKNWILPRFAVSNTKTAILKPGEKTAIHVSAIVGKRVLLSYETVGLGVYSGLLKINTHQKNGQTSSVQYNLSTEIIDGIFLGIY